MMIHRIVHKTLANLLEGSGREGRWCSAGRKVIYCSSSVALSSLENLLRRAGSGFQRDFLTICYEIPDEIKAEEILAESLKPDWRLRSGYADCQSIGHSWFNREDALVLKVPSAILPDEFLYIIKTSSPNIKRIRMIHQKSFLPKERLKSILKIEK